MVNISSVNFIAALLHEMNVLSDLIVAVWLFFMLLLCNVFFCISLVFVLLSSIFSWGGSLV